MITEWKRPSLCGSNACPEVTVQWRAPHDCGGGSCPQVGKRKGYVGIRDSNRPNEVAWLSVDKDWPLFLAAAKNGEFDDLAAMEEW